MFGDAVLGDAEDGDACGLEIVLEASKGDGFFGAARCVIAGVEKQHHGAGAQGREGDFVAAIAGQGEIRGGFAQVWHG